MEIALTPTVTAEVASEEYPKERLTSSALIAHIFLNAPAALPIPLGVGHIPVVPQVAVQGLCFFLRTDSQNVIGAGSG
ncbi:uncharacterized protein N7459_010067 [Penicillium hispanicum]|uniref:uncharacterized protein n=1 Tax=Penicillium hispanicum TaxID=1080232 RepID=UPI00253FFD9F|nr:uncharacterized protein N7459_010067 [Penicillium hispanicum]KAJ5566685.1 hypothetical protein N7459_010067 [Penicillium hispanicum]